MEVDHGATCSPDGTAPGYRLMPPVGRSESPLPGIESAIIGAGAPMQGSASMLKWKHGVELPPFSSSNAVVVSLLKALVDGTTHNQTLHSIAVTEAVAVQI